MKTFLNNIKKRRIIQKYSPKIYTKDGDYNLRTIKNICIECAVDNPDVYKSPMGDIFINCEMIDPYGENPNKEVDNIIKFIENIILK
jgi:hypothetical protein